MDLGIKGKTALVVAASKGMGKASAMGLAAEGARVVMCARGEAALKEAAAEANRAFGGVDILVANVGGPPPGPFEQMTDEQWKAAFEQVHLSTVRFIREVLPHMKQAKWGRILAIQSSSVKQPVEGLVLSNGIRPGIAGLFKTLAGDLASHGITVNLVLPGRIMTDRFKEHQTDRAKRSGITFDKQVE